MLKEEIHCFCPLQKTTTESKSFHSFSFLKMFLKTLKIWFFFFFLESEEGFFVCFFVFIIFSLNLFLIPNDFTPYSHLLRVTSVNSFALLDFLQNTFFTGPTKTLQMLCMVNRWNPTFNICLICKVWSCQLVLTFWFKTCHSFSYKTTFSYVVF